MRPIVCMITDRHRLEGGRIDALVARVALVARAGSHLVQVRERDLDGGPLVRLVRSCVDAVRETSTRILVNDRVDVALASAAHGVHLRGDSMAASRVREIVPPGFLVGRSVHSIDEARRVTAEGGLDYLIWGMVFESRSKPQQESTGLSALAAVAAATPLPVLAVGGVAADNVGRVMQSGAAGFAAIGLFAETSEAEVRGMLDKWKSGRSGKVEEVSSEIEK